MARSSIGGNPVVHAMLSYVPCPNFARRARRPDFSGWGISEESATLLAADANAFLLGAVFDRMIRAELAWESPRLLAERLGHLDVRRIARMSPTTLARFITRYDGQPALHRFHNTIAKCVVSACARLAAEYRADASNIWSRDPGAHEVLRRLQAFDGISQKIAHMMARLLMTYYAVKLSGWNDVDVAVDRHVARVFLRTGLVRADAKRTTYAVGEVKEEVIHRARRLFPKYPGALDEPAFVIGKLWCTAEHAYCRDGDAPCPLLDACPRDRRKWQVI